MITKVDIIPKQITLLNETILESMTEGDDMIIIKNFTEAGIKILQANFGFAWWKFNGNIEYELAYKSPTTPYEPSSPRKRAGNFTALKTRKPFFDSDVKKENYDDSSNIIPYMKSYVIIPISHRDYLYGTIILCYKEQHIFTEEEVILAEAIGNTTAQAITIHRLLEKEKEEYKREIQLKETEELLQEEKSKIEFIANLSHELRTPLTIIKGNVDLALLDEKSKSAKKVLETINNEAEHLSNILSDLVLITTKKKQLSDISGDKINLRDLVKDNVDRYEIIARKRNISIIAKSIPNIEFLGSRFYINKLLLNLIGNSINYGKEGGETTITAKESKGFITIEVSDNGIGISEVDLPHIFERFYRADKSHSSGRSGTGLGLAIVKWIVTLHDGTIEVKSKEGEGTTFTITLPIKVTLFNSKNFKNIG